VVRVTLALALTAVFATEVAVRMTLPVEDGAV
jgi:hypothetical protein